MMDMVASSTDTWAGVGFRLTRCMSINDETASIASLKAQIASFNAQRDWGQFHSPRNLAMAVSVEAAELLELFLWCEDEGPQPAVASREARVAEEAADVAITLLNLCEQAGIDLSSAIQAKLAANADKYPVGKARGRMLKHDEL